MHTSCVASLHLQYRPLKLPTAESCDAAKPELSGERSCGVYRTLREGVISARSSSRTPRIFVRAPTVDGPRFAVITRIGLRLPHQRQSQPMTDRPAIVALRAAFANLTPRSTNLSNADVDLLRGRVCAAVDEMKASGVLPERIVVAVKTVASNAGSPWRNNPLYEELVRWCVERYFGARDSTIGPDGPSGDAGA